jgi:hypothetical protein
MSHATCHITVTADSGNHPVYQKLHNHVIVPDHYCPNAGGGKSVPYVKPPPQMSEEERKKAEVGGWGGEWDACYVGKLWHLEAYLYMP